MPRAKRKATAETDVEDEEPKTPRRRGRRKAAASEDAGEETAKPTRRRGRPAAKKEAEDSDGEEAPKRRRGRAKAKAAPKAEGKRTRRKSADSDEITAKNGYQTVDLDDDAVVVVGDKEPIGKNQKEVISFMTSRKRRKTTAGQVKDFITEEMGKSNQMATTMVNGMVWSEMLAEG